MSSSIHDTDQYSDRSVRRYERIFGADYLSTGGPDTTRDICAQLNLRPETRVLDVGSGIGGSAFHISRTYGSQVVGVDLLPQLVDIANERAAARGIAGVSFLCGDILDIDLPEGGFDVVYSRDALLYIEDKHRLYTRMLSLLAPGGTLFVSDYACGPGELSAEFVAYTQDAGYHLRSVAGYGEVLEAAGFSEVNAIDKRETFIEVMTREIERVKSLPDDPEEGISPEDRDYLVERWQRKIEWCKAGDMAWGHFHGRRP